MGQIAIWERLHAICLVEQAFSKVLEGLDDVEHFERAGKVPVTMYNSWSNKGAKGSVRVTHYWSEMVFIDMCVG